MPAPEPLRRTIGNTRGAFLPVALVGDEGGRPRCIQLGEGGCTHVGGVLVRVLGRIMCLVDSLADPQGGLQVLLRHRDCVGSVEGQNQDHQPVADRRDYIPRHPLWLLDRT